MTREAARAQPVGDATYDPSCFRLIRTRGVLTITRSGGNPNLIVPFENQLYFMNLPQDNTNVVGEIYYTFLALDGPCQTSVTPYQEVASGYDNEKFNADYGTSLPRVASDEPEITLDKSGNVTVTPGSRITYTVAYSNTGDDPAGLSLNSMPLVLSDTIPASTTLVGDIEASGFTVLYSTDDGETYTTTQPSPISTVTNIQLWYTDSLAAHTGGVVTFSVQVDNNPTDAFVENCVDAQFDSAGSFVTDCQRTLISGTNTLGDYVWRDEDADGLQDAEEPGINNITVYLYWDDDGDGSQSGVRETGIPSIMVWLEVDLDGDGTYTRVATTKTDADCRVVVDGSDPDLPQGAFRYPYIPSTPTAVTTTISGGNTYLDADFGYDPPGVIGDYVWRDLDRDGYQDEGEPGIGGVVVTVTDGSTYTTTTDLDGYCSFVDLSADDYTVWLDIPTGLAPTITDTDYIAANVGSAGMLSGTTQVSASVTIDSGGDVTSINGTRRAPAAPSTSTSASCWMAV